MLIQRMDKRFEEYEKKSETRVAVSESTCTYKFGLSDAFSRTDSVSFCGSNGLNFVCCGSSTE